MARRFILCEEAATSTEYVVVMALVAFAIVGGAVALGGSISSAYSTLAGKLPSFGP